MEEWVQTLVGRGNFASFGGWGIAVAAVLILLLRILLPAEERKRVRFPLVLLVANIAVVTLRSLVWMSETVDRVFAVLALFLLTVCIARASFLFFVDWLMGRQLKRPLPKIIRDIIQALVYFGVAFVTLSLVGLEPGQLLTTSALLTAVVGLSLQETMGNLFAGLAIQAQRPFNVGDWIKFDPDERLVGRVTEINWRATKVMTIDEIEVTVPNGTLAKAPILNFSQPTRKSRRMVTVQGPYEAAPHRVIAALEEAIDACPGVLATPMPRFLLSGYNDSGIDYEVRFYIDDYPRRFIIDSDVRKRIWYAFKRAGISIPFPIRDTRTVDTATERRAEEERSIESRREALASIDFLAGLPEPALDLLTRLTRVEPYFDGELIIRQGDEGAELFIVAQGEAVVLVGHDPRRATEVARLGPGKFFGEMSLMTGERRNASVRASGPCELYVVGKEELSQVFELDPDLAQHIADVLANRQTQLDERSSDSKADEEKRRDETGMLLRRIRGFFSL